MYKFLLLETVQNGELVLFVLRGIAKFNVDFDLAPGRKVVLILEVGQPALAANLPRQECVVSDENHVVRIDGTERGQSISHNCEQGDEDVVNDVDNIELSSSNIDPAYAG